MKFRPNIMGKKNKAIRIDPTDLDEFRQGLKADPQWAKYADCTDSELVRMAFITGGIYIQPNLVTIPLAESANMLREAMDKAVAKVAAYFGGLARMDPDGNVSISHPEWDTIETFQADPPKPRQPSLLH